MRRSRENRHRRGAGGLWPDSGRLDRAARLRATGVTPVPRTGLATVDYVLILGVVLPLAAFIMAIGPRIIRLAYEMVCVLVSWPLM